ncbi:MAG TPA: hypothetical protein VFV50_10665 [Bdellovibrionales bacterium]|nr:hypothetical protein [Bdellovibrionales bacterium]
MSGRATRLLLALAVTLWAPASSAREVTFSWEPFENVYAYEIRIANEPEFKETLIRKGVKKPSATVDLPIGKYFYKVRALDVNKRPGQWSEAVPFTIPPYPPELKAPKNGTVYSYYEIPPTITLDWKPAEGDIVYEVLISKTTGQKVAETRVKDPKLVTSEITEGDYSWKVRSIYQEIYESPYSDPKFFTVEKKPFKAPELIEPIGGKVMAAYRPVGFAWKKDPAMSYSDVSVKAKEGQGSWSQKDLHKTETFEVPYMEPGVYAWTATNTEAATTPGLTSKEESFEIRNDFVADGNAYVTLGLAPSFYVVKSSGQEFARSALAQYLGLKYYPWEVLGLALDYQTSKLERAPYTIPYQRASASILIRGGTVGFAQEWFVGARQMDLLLADPVMNSYYFVTSGIQSGLNMYGTLARGWKFLLAGLYYKPMSVTSNLGEVVADHYEAEIGVSYNLFDQFWVSYKLRSEKTITNVRDGATTIESEAFRTEPLHIMLSWEY